jgi:hypothetical protein
MSQHAFVSFCDGAGADCNSKITFGMDLGAILKLAARRPTSMLSFDVTTRLRQLLRRRRCRLQ